MSLTKELIEQERHQVQAGRIGDVHLHKEGSFLRAYDWSAFLCCRYLHDFKVTKRQFKGVDSAFLHLIIYHTASAVLSIPDRAASTQTQPSAVKRENCLSRMTMQM